MSKIKSTNYTIHFETPDFIGLKLFLRENKFSKYFILTDKNVQKNCLQLIYKNVPVLKSAKLIVIKPGEINKNLKTAGSIWDFLTKYEADRKALLINIGGGMVTDLGGFAASTYKRGISFINISTSLLAMADASVGGKTGIDYGKLKNHIGTFSDPKGVFINSVLLKSLPQRHILNGYAEIIKAALIADKKMWNNIIKLKPSTVLIHTELIQQSIKIKNTVVMKDPFEKNIRKILNFGHTFGHAVESYFLGSKSDELLHGEAIAVGMICETHLSWQKRMISNDELIDITLYLLAVFGHVPLQQKDKSIIFKLMSQDKKNVAGKINFSLLNGVGKCDINIECSKKEQEQAFSYYCEL